MADRLRAHFGARAPAIPILEARSGASEVQFTSAKARNRLGWRTRSIAETLVDTAESLLSIGGVELAP